MLSRYTAFLCRPFLSDLIVNLLLPSLRMKIKRSRGTGFFFLAGIWIISRYAVEPPLATPDGALVACHPGRLIRLASSNFIGFLLCGAFFLRVVIRGVVRRAVPGGSAVPAFQESHACVFRNWGVRQDPKSANFQFANFTALPKKGTFQSGGVSTVLAFELSSLCRITHLRSRHGSHPRVH